MCSQGLSPNTHTHTWENLCHIPGAVVTPAALPQGAELLDSPRHQGRHGQRGSGRKKGTKWPNMGMVQPQAMRVQ